MKKISWPTAMLLIVALALIWATAMFGKALGMGEEAHAAFVAAIGSISVALASWAPRVFGKDADHDGIPDIIDADTEGES